jgi:hypothetical protein
MSSFNSIILLLSPGTIISKKRPYSFLAVSGLAPTPPPACCHRKSPTFNTERRKSLKETRKIIITILADREGMKQNLAK